MSSTVACAFLVATGAVGMTVGPVSAAVSPVMRTGSLAGPLDVRGGSPATVASLPLSAGNWTVLARGVLRNTTRDATAHPVRCRLAFGGSGDQVLASPVRRDRGDSRQAFLLAHAAHLGAGTDARLRCGAPGSSTGDVVVEDIRMVGFRTNALGVEHELSSEVFYGNADATSQVRLLTGNDALVPGDIRTVATLALPAGSWAISAKATVDHPSDDLGALRCWIDLAPDSGNIIGVVGEEGQPGDRIPIALELVHTAELPVEARLECHDLSDSGTTHIRDIRLVAYRARKVASRELDPGATYGQVAASMRPLVLAGHDPMLRTISEGTRYRTVHRMSLPGASWVVLAVGLLEHPVYGYTDVDCRLGRGGDHDDLGYRLGELDAIGQAQPFIITWAGSFGERRIVRFQCRSDDDEAFDYYFTMLAYRAGTLRTMSLE